MLCDKPRNFRLKGTFAGSTACDIGSNNEEFWYWIKRDDPPYLYHCSYDAMARGNVPLPFPVQPDMVMAALGMADYNPDPAHYEVKVLANRVELSENTVSAQGKRVQKVTVFARGKVDEKDLFKGRPQVVEYKIRDEQGQEVCKATVESVTVEHGAIVPRKLRLTWPAQRMELGLTLHKVETNTRVSTEAFTRSNLPYQSFDLARRSLDAGQTSIQRVRGSQQ
jgi:hypothetical protein